MFYWVQVQPLSNTMVEAARRREDDITNLAVCVCVCVCVTHSVFQLRGQEAKNNAASLRRFPGPTLQSRDCKAQPSGFASAGETAKSLNHSHITHRFMLLRVSCYWSSLTLACQRCIFNYPNHKPIAGVWFYDSFTGMNVFASTGGTAVSCILLATATAREGKTSSVAADLPLWAITATCCECRVYFWMWNFPEDIGGVTSGSSAAPPFGLGWLRASERHVGQQPEILLASGFCWPSSSFSVFSWHHVSAFRREQQKKG